MFEDINNGHIIVENSITIIILDDGLDSISEYPYMLGLGKELTGKLYGQAPHWIGNFGFSKTRTVPIS